MESRHPDRISSTESNESLPSTTSSEWAQPQQIVNNVQPENLPQSRILSDDHATTPKRSSFPQKEHTNWSSAMSCGSPSLPGRYRTPNNQQYSRFDPFNYSMTSPQLTPCIPNSVISGDHCYMTHIPSSHHQMSLIPVTPFSPAPVCPPPFFSSPRYSARRDLLHDFNDNECLPMRSQDCCHNSFYDRVIHSPQAGFQDSNVYMYQHSDFMFAESPPILFESPEVPPGLRKGKRGLRQTPPKVKCFTSDRKGDSKAPLASTPNKNRSSRVRRSLNSFRASAGKTKNTFQFPSQFTPITDVRLFQFSNTAPKQLSRQLIIVQRLRCSSPAQNLSEDEKSKCHTELKMDEDDSCYGILYCSSPLISPMGFDHIVDSFCYPDHSFRTRSSVIINDISLQIIDDIENIMLSPH